MGNNQCCNVDEKQDSKEEIVFSIRGKNPSSLRLSESMLKEDDNISEKEDRWPQK